MTNRAPMSREAFADIADVSRETTERLSIYADLLAKWQARINLVSVRSLTDVWRRHIDDSAQLAPLCRPSTDPIVDLGSGAGFPGLVLSILLDRDTVLVESDARKGAFLREVIRHTGAPARVETARIEALSPISAATFTARALAPMTKLLGYVDHLADLSSDHPQCLFLKGINVASELTDSEKEWTLDAVLHRSRTDDDGRIVDIRKFTRTSPAGR